jgi:hypothetical protein
MFEGIGKLGSYLQQRNLQFQANYKISTGQQFRTAAEIKHDYRQQMVQNVKASRDQANQLHTAFIKQELMNGRELSDEEMRFLKEQDPALYEKAKKAQDAREELRRELKRCKTQAQAQQAVVRAAMKVSSEAASELSSGQAMTAGGGAAGGSSSAAPMTASGKSAAAMDAGSVSAAIGTAANTGIQAAAPMSAGEVSGSPTAGGSEIAAAGLGTAASAAVPASGLAAGAAGAMEPTANGSAGSAENVAGVGAGSAAPGSDTELLLMKLRALQDEWLKYSSRKEYDEMPFDETERIKRAHGETTTAVRTHSGVLAAYLDQQTQPRMVVVDTKIK